MRFLVLSLMMLVTVESFASSVILKCQFKEGGSATFNVSSLMSQGCNKQTFASTNEEFRARYNITVCDGRDAYGVTEVLTSAGDWAPVREFSNERTGECFLTNEFRPIRTNYPCRPSRFGHRGGCE